MFLPVQGLASDFKRYTAYKGMNLFRTPLILGIIIFITTIPSFSFGKDNSAPTAIVVDAETGQPIEGAVAIAIWREHSIKARAWWEGGTQIVARIEEAKSNKDGQFYIPDYWSSGNQVHVTVYKYGYICWDQEHIYQKSQWRTDFDKSNRNIRLEKPSDNYTFNRHERFVSRVTGRKYGTLFGQEFMKEINNN